MTLDQLNALPAADFIATLGGIFEHASWVPQAVAGARPFAGLDALHAAMVSVVMAAPPARQEALLRAHPVLARRATLTAASQAEQDSHGLRSLDAGEVARFEALNDAYLARFGFPFIIAVRGQRDRAAILRALEARLDQSPAAEHATALAEVAKIGRFRLEGLLA